MDSPVVTIDDGQLKGTHKANLDGENFHAFLGIPFGKPPVGKLRFKAPEPSEPWTGIKDASNEGNMCFQRDFTTKVMKGSEDCLNLNVFTKTLPFEGPKLKPVMVWIYGGAFRLGSNSPKTYGPEYLLTEDIVLVVPNYRVGFLGFFHLTDTSLDVPGNAGLKDQLLALKWVQKHIKNFNGDPNNVTIFGESAGSKSAHQLLLSASAKGLFHKAILQSGVVLNPSNFCKDSGLKFAKHVQADTETEAQALEVLQGLSVKDLYEQEEKFFQASGGSRVIGPNIEKPNKTATITSDPAELIASGQYNKVPILLGYCDREGMLMEVYRRFQVMAGVEPFAIYSKIELDNFIHPDLQLAEDDPKRLIIKNKLTELYLQPPNVDDKWLLPSDYSFIVGIITVAKLHAKTSSEPVYLYRMSLDAGCNMFKKIMKLEDKGACHADDLGYLFSSEERDPFFYKGVIERRAIRRFVKLWTNFARTGNPTPKGNDLNIEWKPVDTKTVHFLDIGEELTVDTDPESERMKVWKEIFELSTSTSNYL
ncbi:unnamed protein product [Psylliodes chrysocephalus]|uniref:Carboxylesterase type B domain-containing protein n=1 Tax=Psylliodes chrysocephalus TaxID=3402493 RepID=A0A9P0D5A7_9CUCU|nr:unnamed protein product [Psylliodes chrysocephala]